MIEVLDIQKNFKNGTEIIKKKMKNNSLTRGKATIQLFDENNKCIEETVSNNFITNPLDNNLMYYYLANQIGAKDTTVQNFSDSRFIQIHLRNGDFEEDEKERFMKGDLIGICDRNGTSAGSDVLRGTYNPTESFEEYTEEGYYHAHMVYDFTTSQANGTFNHIYWSDKGSTHDGVNKYIQVYAHPKYSSSTPSTSTIYVDAFDRFLVKVSNKYYLITNLDKYLCGIHKTIKYDQTKEIDYIPCTHSVNNKGLKIESSYKTASTPTGRSCIITLNLLNEDGSIFKTKTIDLLKLSSFEMLNNKIGDYSAYFQFKDLRFCTKEGLIYFGVQAYSNSNRVLPTVSADGSYTEAAYSKDFLIGYDILNDVFRLSDPYEYNCNTKYSLIYLCQNRYKGEDKYLMFNARYINEIDLNDFTINKLADYNNNNMFISNGVHFDRNIIIGTSAHKFGKYSSHTKLPNPITKTNTTTMKITYDYYIQVPNMCAEEGKEFIWE